MNNYILFSSQLFLDYLLPLFMDHGISLPIFTYKNEVHRKSLRKIEDLYGSYFEIHFLELSKYLDFIEKYKISNEKNLILLDWNKDFFDITPHHNAFFCQPALLPMYRGYGAITEQFLRGVSVGGVTFYRPSEITDAGDIVYQKEIRIAFEDYPEDYIMKVCNEIVSVISNIDLKKLPSKPQNELLSFSLSRIRRKNAIIDFRADALSIYNHIRAYSRPFFGAFCYLENEKITVFKAKPEKWQGDYGYPGEVLTINDYGAEVACGSGTVLLMDIDVEKVVLKKSCVLNKYLKID
ncbi:MAG: formyltransferase family protein [Calditerrivibrio sp.]|nr:formyltransferase family protein [Calditerrivibrio sp.]